ncbi:putative membrane protein [Helicobacter pylori CPY1662]|nr:putative membrane protein [Helicobacter pylori CPY1662]
MLEYIVFLFVKGVYQLANSVFNAYLLGISLKNIAFYA